MKVVVTGGAGFIGAHVCRELAGRGHTVVAYDNLSTGTPYALTGLPVDLVVGDVLDEAELARTVAGANAVVHLAAIVSVPASLSVPHHVHEVNAGGTLNVLAAARAHAAPGAPVVLASSAAVYGQPATLPLHEDLPARPRSPYGASKAAAEAYAHAWTAAYGMPVLTLRLFNVYGPGQRYAGLHSPVVPAFCHRAVAGYGSLFVEGGRQSRDFVHVSVVAAVIAQAVQQRRTAAAPVNVACGVATTIADLADQVAVVAGRELTVQYSPVRDGDVGASQADVGRLWELFPILPDIPLQDGLRSTMQWLREQSVGTRPDRAPWTGCV